MKDQTCDCFGWRSVLYIYPVKTFLCQFKDTKGKWITKREVLTIEEASHWYQTTTHWPKVRVQLKTVNVETLPEQDLVKTPRQNNELSESQPRGERATGTDPNRGSDSLR